MTRSDVLSNVDIDKLLSKCPKFKGCYARDALPKKPLKLNESIIINMDDATGPGTHWVALFQYKKDTAFYFDSFGVVPPMEVQRFAKQGKKQLIYNSDQIQGINSERCGWYCIELLKSLYTGESLYSVLADFTRGPSAHNEAMVKNSK